MYFFLDRDLVDQLPYIVASQLGVFPGELDHRIMHLLADCLIPFTVSNSESFASLSIPAVLLLVFQHNGDPGLSHSEVKCCHPDTGLHTWILERVMAVDEKASEVSEQNIHGIC